MVTLVAAPYILPWSILVGFMHLSEPLKLPLVHLRVYIYTVALTHIYTVTLLHIYSVAFKHALIPMVLGLVPFSLSEECCGDVSFTSV